MPIGFHVIGVDIRHHRHHGQQVQEGCIGLVGLHHDVVARAELGVGAGAVQAPTDHKRRVQTPFGQYTGHQAGGGGFAMGAGDGNALLEAHQLGQHQGPRHHWNAHFTRRKDFRVVRLHGGGCDHRVDRDQVAGCMAHKSPDPQPAQALQRRAVREVRA